MVGDGLDIFALMIAVPERLSNEGVEDGSHSGSEIKPLENELFFSPKRCTSRVQHRPSRGTNFVFRQWYTGR